MSEVTKVREPNFSLDLPGEWMAGPPSEDDATLTFVEVGGAAKANVTLLRVRPLFEIADKERLLGDYMQHRQNFESGKEGALKHSEPVTQGIGEGFEGEWYSEDLEGLRRIQHRVLLVGWLLADFAYENSGVDPKTFAEQSSQVLGAASASE
ncbi:MAG: hypothetical protein P4L93_04020 [Coriobacteriia bacterium]|nr:hypothetical protein [Coriobacteriia bacterium]